MDPFAPMPPSTMTGFGIEEAAAGPPPDPAEVEAQLRLMQALATINASEAVRRGDSLGQYAQDTGAGILGGLTTIPQMLGDAAGYGINSLNLAPNTETVREPFAPVPEFEALKGQNPVAALGGTMLSPGLGPVMRGGKAAYDAYRSLPGAARIATGAGAGGLGAAALASPGEAQTRRGGQAATFSPEIRALQEALAAKGYKTGPIDGLMGPQTGDAIKTFQKVFGLPETGVIDPATSKAIERSKPGYEPPESEKAEIAIKQAREKAEIDRINAELKAKELERLRRENEEKERAASAESWQKLKDTLYFSLPTLLGMGIGGKLGQVIGRRQGQVGLDKVQSFGKIASEVKKTNATPGNLAGTPQGDDLAELLNKAYQLGGAKAPFPREALRVTQAGTPESIARSVADKHGKFATQEATAASIAKDLQRSEPFAGAAGTERAVQGEANKLAELMAPSSAAKGADEFFKKDPTKTGWGHMAIPATGLTDAGIAGTIAYTADPEKEKEKKDIATKMSGLGLGIAGGYLMGNKATRQLMKSLPAMKASPLDEAAVSSARSRMDRDLASFQPATKSPAASGKRVDQQTPAERKQLAEAGRKARQDYGKRLNEIRSDPKAIEWIASQSNLGPRQLKAAVAEKFGADLKMHHVLKLRDAAAEGTRRQGVEKAQAILTQRAQQAIATGQGADVWQAIAQGGARSLREIKAIAPEVKAGMPEVSHLSDRQLHALLRAAAKAAVTP